MGLYASSIPNLVGGVSQQPAALRLSTTCERMENAWPSVVSGLMKRPPSQHVASINGLNVTDGLAAYIIERDDTYRYMATIANGDLQVFNLSTGTSQTVTFPNGKSYLTASSPVDNFRFVTVGDYTFIVNRNQTVASTYINEPISGTRLNPDTRGVVYVAAAVANTYYTIYINGVLKGQYLTPKGVDGGSSVPDTSAIAGALATDLIANGYTVTQTGSTIVITNLTVNDKIRTQGNTGDKSVRCFKDSVQSFSDLPPQAPEGLIVTVRGDAKDQGDDYYVIFQNGVWVECSGYGDGRRLDNATMPHVLIRNNDGTWTFKRHTWKDRLVGDDDSNSQPSFVGYTIKDIFLYGNRLGFLSDENVILSETANYENFYRTTVATLIDSDRIDIAVLTNNINTLQHAIQFNNDLLLMSDRSQFRLKYQNFLGPKTLETRYTTSYNVSPRIKPVNTGASIYFVDDRTDNQFMKMYEYYPKENVFYTDDADEVTAPVPEYIRRNVQFMASSNRAKVILLNTAFDPKSLYLYKYYWAGDKKVQTSWSKWTFDDCEKIHWGAFSGSIFYMLIERKISSSTTGLFLERIRCDEDVFDSEFNYETLLDRRFSPNSISYDSTNDRTVITLPYATTATNIQCMGYNLAANISGYEFKVTKISNTQIYIPGNVLGYAISIGIPYTFLFEFSPVYPRQSKGGGEVVILDGRLQVRYITIEYHDTAYFATFLALPGRDTFTSTFAAASLGNATDLIGSQSFHSGYYRIPVMSKNIDAKLWITNDTPFPSAFGSAEWSGQWSPKANQRI